MVYAPHTITTKTERSPNVDQAYAVSVVGKGLILANHISECTIYSSSGHFK